MLAAGEGLHRTYWKRYHDREKPGEAKLEIFAVMRQGETPVAIEKLAQREFDKLWETHKAEIKKLPASDRAHFQQLIQASGKAVSHGWELPERIVEKPGRHVWLQHLFANAKGEFLTDLNGWESAFLDWTKEQPGFVCWLRNFPRRDWAFCVPYEMGGEKPFYPDFVIVRKNGNGFEVDILEPHDDSRTDTWAKVKGLAKFADDHHLDFGRLLVGRKKAGKLEVVNVADGPIREKARAMGSPNDLEALFEEL